MTTARQGPLPFSAWGGLYDALSLSLGTPAPPRSSKRNLSVPFSLCVLPAPAPQRPASFLPHLSALHIPPQLLGPTPGSLSWDLSIPNPMGRSFLPLILPYDPWHPTRSAPFLLVWGTCYLLMPLACRVFPACHPSQGWRASREEGQRLVDLSSLRAWSGHVCRRDSNRYGGNTLCCSG